MTSFNKNFPLEYRQHDVNISAYVQWNHTLWTPAYYDLSKLLLNIQSTWLSHKLKVNESVVLFVSITG